MGKFAQPDPFDLALPLYYGVSRDLETYRSLVQLAADAGDPLALYAMATWFLLGSEELGVKRNVGKSVKLLQRASRTLNRAMYDLAVCKLQGDGTRKDIRGAYRLFAEAADLGCLAAMKEQAECLRHGIGVKRDQARARRVEQRLVAIQGRLERISAPKRGLKGKKSASGTTQPRSRS